MPGTTSRVRRVLQAYDASPDDSPVAHAEALVNTSLVELLAKKLLLFHAGAVAYRGAGVLFPAAHGAGKSTLVAALVAHGFSYYGDDIAPVDPTSLMLLPYAKSICVKAGSRHALQSWYPDLRLIPPRARFGDQRVWYLQPPSGDWPAAPAPVRCIVLPRHVPGAQTTLRAVSRTAALEQLYEQTFCAGATDPRAGAHLRRTVALVQDAACYALTVGALDRAVALLMEVAQRG
ncbi:MAG TPA: hypothetical protein VFX49_18890 [Chloroflexota bacterium]|nr:hypothetical protein [Chloroflexota bacterium]